MLKQAFFHTFSSLIQLNNMLQGSFLFHSKTHTRLHRLTQPPALANTYGCVSQRSRMCKQGGMRRGIAKTSC